MPKRILFIHHSTGGNLLHQGHVRAKLYSRTSDIELWDHGYNLYPFLPKILAQILPTFHTGLSDGQGKLTGIDYSLQISNKDISCYLPIFDRSHPSLGDILQFDGVIFKMCFPSTRIESDAQLQTIQQTYQNLVHKLANYSNSFGIFTPPPLRYEVTNTENAKRVMQLRSWMLQELQLLTNVKLFDFCGLTADLNTNSRYYGTLKRGYCSILWFDSHPNRRANKEAGEQFADFIVRLTS